MSGAGALTAGLLLIVVSVIASAAFAAVGYVLGSATLGFLFGLPFAFAAGFWAVWKIYWVPMRAASLAKDYSHLKPQWDDDKP